MTRVLNPNADTVLTSLIQLDAASVAVSDVVVGAARLRFAHVDTLKNNGK
jgi:hypothetical protein